MGARKQLSNYGVPAPLRQQGAKRPLELRRSERTAGGPEHRAGGGASERREPGRPKSALYLDMHRKPLPGQRGLFEPPDLEEIIADVPNWPDTALTRVGRVIGVQLIKHKRPVPLALDVGLKMHGRGLAGTR